METTERSNEQHNLQRMITALFTDQTSLESAYKRLNDMGYTKDEVNLIMMDETRKRFNLYPGMHPDMSVVALNGAENGAGVGAAVGATVGAVIGIVAAIGTSILIPGLGLLVAGPIAAGLAGAGAGGVAGGIIGSLAGVGFAEDKARLYEKGLKDGAVILGVHPHHDEDAVLIQQMFLDMKGTEVHW
ncbi:MAG: hypothetical protein IT257_05665 [Chitinophagaceae bacterium]|nr:hypothetical protein [Chitinophagaceae bacterium]